MAHTLARVPAASGFQTPRSHNDVEEGNRVATHSFIYVFVQKYLFYSYLVSNPETEICLFFIYTLFQKTSFSGFYRYISRDPEWVGFA